jgi:hypothetical protein
MHPKRLSRRDFLKLSSAALGGLALRPFSRLLAPLPDYPVGQKLGRVSVAPTFYTTELKTAPHRSAAAVRSLEEDTVVEWLREVVGTEHFSSNARWVETPEGFVYAPHVQPVYYLPNTPLTVIPDGKPGFWAEVTVPYVNMSLDNPPARSPWVQDTLAHALIPRLYYGQVVWIDRVQTRDDGRVLYRFNEDIGRGYGFGDMFWVDGAAFRPLTEEEIAPISPEVDPADKTIQINLTYQTLSCFESGREVFFCRVSSGYPTAPYATPVGVQHIHWKTISQHMSGGTSGGGWDTAGVSWATYIHGDGIAIHAAFWHNDFGMPRSRGCINVTAEDAKWIFRWTTPYLTLDNSEARLRWPDHGTVVEVVERKF